MRNPKLSVQPYFFLYYHNYYLAFKLPLSACCMRRPGYAGGGHSVQMSLSAGQLESMMLRPHRGTASFCVSFGVKKGVKVPPSGRYDLFVPRTPGFPCIFRY